MTNPTLTDDERLDQLEAVNLIQPDEDLTDAFFVQPADRPAYVSDRLRRELAGWPVSYWRKLAHLIQQHINQGG